MRRIGRAGTLAGLLALAGCAQGELSPSALNEGIGISYGTIQSVTPVKVSPTGEIAVVQRHRAMPSYLHQPAGEAETIVPDLERLRIAPDDFRIEQCDRPRAEIQYDDAPRDPELWRGDAAPEALRFPITAQTRGERVDRSAY